MILSNKWITTALIRLLVCAGWPAPLLLANPWRQVFSRRDQYIVPRARRTRSQTRPRGYKTFFMLNSGTKCIMLINVKMPTIIGILTFISIINTTSESLKARKVVIFQLISFYDQLRFHAQLRGAWRKLYYLGVRTHALGWKTINKRLTEKTIKLERKHWTIYITKPRSEIKLPYV